MLICLGIRHTIVIELQYGIIVLGKAAAGKVRKKQSLAAAFRMFSLKAVGLQIGIRIS